MVKTGNCTDLTADHCNNSIIEDTVIKTALGFQTVIGTGRTQKFRSKSTIKIDIVTAGRVQQIITGIAAQHEGELADQMITGIFIAFHIDFEGSVDIMHADMFDLVAKRHRSEIVKEAAGKRKTAAVMIFIPVVVVGLVHEGRSFKTQRQIKEPRFNKVDVETGTFNTDDPLHAETLTTAVEPVFRIGKVKVVG